MLPEIVLNYINKKKTEPRKEYTRVKDSDIPEILDMRKKGILLRVIAKRFGYSYHTVSVICRRENISPGTFVTFKPVWTKERKDMLAEMWNRGDNIDDIALRLKKTVPAIQSHLTVLKEEGYHIVKRKKGRPQKTTKTK